MSPRDRMFLAIEAPNQPMNTGSVALVAAHGGDRDGVRAMVAAALARNRVALQWRRRPHRSLASLGQWCWRTGDVDLDYHVRTSGLAAGSGLDELWDAVSRLHGEPLDRARPLWRLHVFDGLADGRCALYLKVHHAHADGAGAVRLLTTMAGSDPHQREMAAPWELGRPQSAANRASDAQAVMHTVLGGTAAALLVPPALLAAAWQAVRGRGGPLSLAAPHTEFNVPVSADRTFAGHCFSLRRLQRIANRTDATVDEVVLAMCAGALRRYLLAREVLPHMPLMAMVPVTDGAEAATVMCSLGTHLADPVERLAAVQISLRQGEAMMAGRSRVQTSAVGALSAAPLAVAMLAGRSAAPLRPPNVTLNRVAGSARPAYWNGARIDALYPLSTPVSGQALAISTMKFADRVYLGLTGCRRAVPAIGNLTDLLDRELELLEAFRRISAAPRAGRDDRRRAQRQSRRPAL